MFEFADRICFTKAVYYSMKQIPLYKPFKDGTGGMGKFAPETGFLDLYDDEGCCAHHLAIGRGFVETMLPKLFGGGKKVTMIGGMICTGRYAMPVFRAARQWMWGRWT